LSQLRIINLEHKLGLLPVDTHSYSCIESFSEKCDLHPDDLACDTIITENDANNLRKMGKQKHRLTGYELCVNGGGYFIVLDLDSIASRYKRWFTTHLPQKLRDNIYPLPLGICRKEIADFAHLRETPKKNLCYANFSMTWHGRLNVAEWAAAQDYIDHRFARRFPTLDQDLDDKLLCDDVLPFDEFLATLSSYKYCIAPEGVGVDTDRQWECIFMNVVPVVQNNYANRIFSRIWPMILVNRYEMTDLPKLITEFEERCGKNIQYNQDLLLRKNLPELLDLIEHECRKV
jgi:hypothetical protein